MPKLWNLLPPPPPACLPSMPEQIYSPLLSSFEVLATLKLLTMNMIKMVVGTKQITEVIKISPFLIGICLITSLWRWWGQKKQWDPIIASPAPLSSPNEKLQKCKSAPKQPIVHFICTHCPVSEQDLILLQRAFWNLLHLRGLWTFNMNSFKSIPKLICRLYMDCPVMWL